MTTQVFSFSIQPCKKVTPWQKVFEMEFHADLDESYFKIKCMAEKVAQDLANGLNFYHVKYEIVSGIENHRHEYLIQAPFYFGAANYTKPIDGW